MRETGQESFQVSEEIRRRAEAIALIMGGDYNMTVGVGAPGSGWHWDFTKNHVNMDPLDLLNEDPEVIKGVAAHEGNHRAFSRPEHVKDMWQEQGFSFGFNALEDPRINQGGMKFRPGTKDWIQAYIEKDLGPGGGLDYEGIQRDTTRSLGYVPKHMQWGSEMIRYWHARELGKTIQSEEDVERFLDEIKDPEVKDSVRNSIPAFDKFYNTLPDTKNEADVQISAREAANIFKDQVWDGYSKLVEKSYNDQSLVEMIKDMLQNDPQIDFQSPGQGSGGQGISIPFSSLPKDIQDEIKKKIDEMQKNQETQSGSGEQGISSEEDQEQGQEASGSSQQNNDSGANESEEGESSSEGSRSEEGKDGKQSNQEANQSGSSQGSGDKDSNTSLNDQIPWDELSEKAKAAIRNAFEQNSEDVKDEFKKRAKESLEGAEDKANEKMRGQMADKQNTETHQERKEREAREQDRSNQQRQAQQLREDAKKMRNELANSLPKDLYHEALTLPDVASIIRLQDREYKRIFTPDESPSTRYSYSGLHPSMSRAMQAEADARKGNIFEIKGRPMEKSHRFVWLVDVSPSMADKITETFKFIVIATELANKHGLETAVIGFTDTFPGTIRVYKDFDVKRLAQKDRQKLGQIIPDCLRSNATPTKHATNATYKLLTERMSRYPAQHNYFITLTDGQPTDSSQDEMQTIIKNIRKNSELVTTGFGIGPGTEFVNNIYPQLPERVRRDIARKIGRNFNDVSNSYITGVEFAAASVIIMGYMVEHPELFR